MVKAVDIGKFYRFTGGADILPNRKTSRSPTAEPSSRALTETLEIAQP